MLRLPVAVAVVTSRALASCNTMLRSAAVVPAWRWTVSQLSSIHVQLSGVSSQRSGLPVLPLVWWQRV